MTYQLKSTAQGTEAIIDDNCSINKFYAIANALADDLQIQFMNQIDDAETLDWDFKYKDQFLTLHYSIFNGVSILPASSIKKTKNDHALMEVANFLQRYSF
jgi:hypothetical protein